MNDVAARKRPEGRKNYRLTVEIYDEDQELMRRARVAAALAGVTLRELVLLALTAYVDGRDPAP